MTIECCGKCIHYDKYVQEGVKMNDGSKVWVKQCILTGLETEDDHEGCELFESE